MPRLNAQGSKPNAQAVHRSVCWLGIALCALSLVAIASEPLRICADPNNLPFTNSNGDGFENKIAVLLARDLGTRVEYTWFAQRRGFLRNTLTAQKCDVVMGLPVDTDAAWTTKPYYRSTYVFVTRRSRHLHVRSFDDPQLRQLRIGVELVGDQRVPGAQQTKRDGWAARVDGERIGCIFCAHGCKIGLKVPQRSLRQGLSVRPKKSGDAAPPFAGLGGLRGG